MARLWCVIIGYVFGTFQTAFFYGKLHGIDIREHGSGNAGTTNTLRVLGTKAGLIVFAGDMLKSVIAILLVKHFLEPLYPDLAPLLEYYTGAGCVLGHNYPFYMQFKGGKGIATTGGMMIAINPWYIPFGLVLFFGNLILDHFVSLGSLLLYTGFFVQTVIMGQMGIIPGSDSMNIELYILVFLLTVLAFYKHKANIGRLLAGNERKTYLFKKNKMDVETNASASKKEK